VDAAQALANFAASRTGKRKGRPVAFPRFKSRHKTAPAFRLRNRARPGTTQAIRVVGPKSLRLPTLGDIRIHGCTRMIRRMLDTGRLHLYSASIRFERGRWWVSLTGLVAQFHPARRAPSGRHPNPAGLDRGVKSLAVVVDTDGVVLRAEKGVKALQHAQTALRRANKALARTKPGSGGRRKAKQRLTRIHARVAHLRGHTAHQLAYWAATSLTRLTVEDLNVAGMTRLRSLARSVADAGMGDLGRLLAYKARWYGLDLVVADRWYPSSKTCSGCGNVNANLELGERIYRCAPCGLVLDRDVNAAVNLARWPDHHRDHPPLVAAA
jgi:putative transposase